MDRFGTAHKMKFLIKGFFRKCNQIRSLESFKHYLTPLGGGRVVNFVTNRYGNWGEPRGVSAMSLRNADKNFLYGQFHEKLIYTKLLFVAFNLKNPGIQVKIILVIG